MIVCKDLTGKTFATKKDMFLALKQSKEEIIALKKTAIKFSDAVDFQIKDSTTKDGKQNTKLSFGDYIYPVINTTNYLDSHGDVHLPGIWDKSIPAQQGKTYLIINHELSLGNVISYPNDVEPMVKQMEWASLGKSYEGSTQALIFKSKITEKSNPAAYMAYRDGEAIQHSIRMQYVKIELAINDDSEDFKEEKATFDKHIDVIANKEDAINAGFFWAVTEAKIYKEGSAVLFGSNDATPTLYNLDKEIQPPASIENPGPPTSSHQLTNLFNPNLI